MLKILKENACGSQVKRNGGRRITHEQTIFIREKSHIDILDWFDSLFYILSSCSFEMGIPMKRPARKEPKVEIGRGTIIRREKSKRAPSNFEEEKRNIPRGMKHHHVKRINCPLTYQKWITGADDEQKRWYVLGAVKIAFVHIFVEGTQQSGNVQVFMNSRMGNGGTWFGTVREAKNFIISELKRDMNQ